MPAAGPGAGWAAPAVVVGALAGGAAGLALGWRLCRAAGGGGGPSRRLLVAVSGTLQEGFELRKNLDGKRAKAVFLGWALVRGVKLFLDIKPQGCREHVPAPKAQSVNPVLVPTGDRLDANVYAVYAVPEESVLRALLREPRCLGMTPDTALVDLDAEETTPALAEFLRGRAEESLGGGVSPSRAAVLTVVGYVRPSGSQPLPPLYKAKDGTRVTSFAPCLRKFAGGSDDPVAVQLAIRKAQARALAAVNASPYSCAKGVHLENGYVSEAEAQRLGGAGRFGADELFL